MTELYDQLKTNNLKKNEIKISNHSLLYTTQVHIGMFTACASNPLGIQESLKYVKDAQLSAYKTYSTYFSENARLDGSGWIGIDSNSNLQIDFGKYKLFVTQK